MDKISEEKMLELRRYNINIHPESRIKAKEVNIGECTNINGPICIKGGEPISIGKFCAIGDYIVIHSSGHDYSKPNLQMQIQNHFNFVSIYTSKRNHKVTDT